MLVILKIYNFIKFFTVLFLSFFLLSCGDKKPTNVSSGIAQLSQTVFSKTCSAGSFSISKKTSASTLTGSGDNKLNVGDRVSITGRVTNASPCYTSSVSFTCEATMIIGQNRSFICDSGTVSTGFGASPSLGGTPIPGASPSLGGIPIPGASPSLGGTPTLGGYTPNTGYNLPPQRDFIRGEFHTFGNGQQASGHLILGSSSSLVPHATCRVGFFCAE